MFKKSNYNYEIVNDSRIILYNSIKDQFVEFEKDEFVKIDLLLNDLPSFNKQYPLLFNTFIDFGFIIPQDFDELGFLKMKNSLLTYNNGFYWLTINPTLECNLNCWYCAVTHNETKNTTGKMSPQTIKKIGKHIFNKVNNREISWLHLDWFGGEPLLFFEIFQKISKIAAEITKDKIPFTQHITTNGVLIDSKKIQIFQKYNCNSFQITLDGDKKTHDKIKNIKGAPTYDTVLSNINELCSKLDQAKIILRINYTEKTLDHIEDIVNCINVENRKKITIDLQRVWQVKKVNIPADKIKKVSNFFIQNDFVLNNWAFKPKRYYNCYSDRWNHMAINFDGGVFKCTARDYGNDLEIGVIDKNGFIETNNNFIKYFGNSVFDLENCKKCKELPLCFGPCIQKRYENQNAENTHCLLEENELTVDDYIKYRVNGRY